MFCGLRVWFMLIFITGMAFFVYSLSHEKPLVRDSVEYSNLANNLISSNQHYAGEITSPKDFRLYSKRTIGYPIYLIFQWRNGVIASFTQILLVIFNFLLGLFLLKSLKSFRYGYFLFSIGYIFQVTLFIHGTFLLSDLLLTTLIMSLSCVALDNKLDLKHKIKYIGILWAFALLVKPVILPSVFLTPIIALYFYTKHKSLSLYLASPIAVWIIICSINYNATGVYEYSSISTINIAQYNAKLAIANSYGYDSAQAFTEADIFAVPHSEKEYKEYKKNVSTYGSSAILENLGSYIKVHFTGIIKMIADPGRFELYTFFNQPTSKSSLTELIYSKKWSALIDQLNKAPILLALLAILLLINMLKIIGVLVSLKSIKTTIIPFAIITYFLVITGPIGAARFFLPVSILFLVFSSIGWSFLFDSFQKRSKR